MSNKKALVKIWLVFFALLFIFVANFTIKSDISPTSRMWLVLDGFALIIAIVILAKYGLPNKKHIIISVILGLLMFVAALSFNFSSIKSFICTTIAALAVLSVSERFEKTGLVLLGSKSKKYVLITIGIGISVGVVLGIINLAISNGILNLKLSIECILLSLNPGIYEEIALRALFYSFCIAMLNGEIVTKLENFTCYFIMIIPHVMIHTPEQFLNYGFISGIMSILILTILFGLPFAILQRKRDITSAMISHGLVDTIRFSFLGLPY